MKKYAAVMLALLMSVGVLSGCSSLLQSEHDVNLVLLGDGEAEIRLLTSKSEGEDILSPEEYKIFPSLIEGKTVSGSAFYLDENLNEMAFFPLRMPDKDLNLYVEVRPLTKLSNIRLADPNIVETYFLGQGELIEDDIFAEEPYYEIQDRGAAGIVNDLRYYPASKKLYLLRGYSENEAISDKVLWQDQYNSGITIDLAEGSYKFVGIYARRAYALGSTGGGTVNISFSIDSMAVDDKSHPLLPSYVTVEYTSKITEAANEAMMRELWDSAGYDYAKKCYGGLNTLLQALCSRISVFA